MLIAFRSLLEWFMLRNHHEENYSGREYVGAHGILLRCFYLFWSLVTPRP